MLTVGIDDGSIAALLREVCQAAGLEGLAIIEPGGTTPPFQVSHSAGGGGPNTLAVGHGLLTANPGGAAHTTGLDLRPIIACPWLLPPSRSGGLVLWRAPGSAGWTEADHGLVASLALVLRVSIASSVGQIAIDRVTSLPNRRWFIDEADRHIDRLDQDGEIGTLLLVDVGDLSRLNATLGAAVGDGLLARLASQLRAMVRPADVLARVGVTEFAVWQDGMDHLTAAERADALCSAPLFKDLPPGYTITPSIGIASRQAGGVDDVRTLLRRAHMAAREVKILGRGGWRVSHAPIRRGGAPRAR